jgi:hypothetical protein
MSTTGGKPGTAYIEYTWPSPLTVPGSPYQFTDPATGDPIASVTVTAGQIDQLSIRVYPDQLPLNLARKRYVKRYWQLSHVGSGWTADVTFPYTPQESSMITDASMLRGIRQPYAGGGWEDPIAGTASSSDIRNYSVTVMGLNEFNIGGNVALAHPYMVFGRDAAGEVTPSEVSLLQNYPNPFNPSTVIPFTLPEAAHVRLAVYDRLGQEMAVLVDGSLPAGTHRVAFDVVDLPSGLYYYRLVTTGRTFVRTMTLTR